MILRRIIAHFRTQEWTAIGIEFVIVVLGVFVGIQVANWNADAADRRRADAYVERLTADMEGDLAARRADVAYYAAVLDSLVRTNELLADPASDPQDLVVSAYRASEILYSAPTRATWDEIVSSGDVSLLPSEAVDAGVAEYFSADTGRLTYESLIGSDYRRLVRQIIPLETQIELRAGCSDQRDAEQRIIGFMEQCTLRVDPASLRRTADAIRASGEVRAALRYQYSNVYSARANLSGDVVYLEQALAALRGE